MLEWDLMQHPLNSSDKASSDYYLFLQLHFDGTIFHSNDEVINEIDCFLDLHTLQFLAEKTEKLPKCWQTIVDLNGDYYPHELF